jgi:hypothetical protein
MSQMTTRAARRIPAVLLGLALALLASPAALAWNDFGHRVAAAAAWPRLAPATRAEVTELLKLNPDYPRWVRGVAAGGRAQVACVDALEHRYWHFIDLPFSSDHTPLRAPARPNIETELRLMLRTLRSPSASAALKSYDLTWVEHLVGDAHQPLHAVSRFTRTQPEGDAGGNRVALCARPCRRNLHAFWDDILGRARGPQAAIRYAAGLPAAPPAEARIGSPRRWLEGSRRIAERDVYAPPIGDGAGPYRLDARYRRTALAIARRQIALAGARLAWVLNRDLSPSVR